jgi:hypothetical protein
MKICNKCKEEKPFSEFGKDKTSKDGYSAKCSICYKQYYQETREKRLEVGKIYDQNNKKRKSEYIKKFYKENKEYFQKWNEENKEKQREYFRKRLKNNPDYYKEYAIKNKDKIREYDNQRRKNNIQVRLAKNLRSTLHRLVVKTKKNKSNSALKLLGCTLDYFRQHLEQQFLPEMNWENYGIIWEIDHIKPCFTFDLSKKEEQEQCFHYSNMRPLFKTTAIAESFGYKDYTGNQNRNKSL